MGEETVTTATERSYSDMVLDSLESARESVRKAIEHYEAQRADEVRRHEETLAVVEGQLATLRMSLAPQPTPVKPAAARGNGHLPIWKRLEGILSNGPLQIDTAAKQLGVVSPSVYSAIAIHAEKFVRFEENGRIAVRLKRA